MVRAGRGSASSRPTLVIGRGGVGARESLTFSELAARVRRLAAGLSERGIGRGSRVLLMLPNSTALFESLLACIRVGAVIVPATVQLTTADLQDRVDRGGIRHAIVDRASRLDGVSGLSNCIVTGDVAPNCLAFESVRDDARGAAPAPGTTSSDPMLLYFTSGTTKKPKLVEHTHATYPVGHLSTMYFLGLMPGDVHLNVSSPGWAKHAWSNVFAPWNAEATVVALDHARFDGKRLLEVLASERVTTLCAPPTVWRMLILEDLASASNTLREVAAAGEPLNPEIVERVRAAWKLTVRDGFGQTETTAMIGNTPGQKVKLGSMGRPLPGYAIELLDGTGHVDGRDGEISVALAPAPAGLMIGYADDAELTQAVMREGFYRTGDLASADSDGFITYVGRTDDVFKASDYRISPFELESVLLEHPLVAEAAVVPSPDPLRLSVPKAFVALTPGAVADEATARDILGFVRERVPPFKRVRRLEFGALPKTVSGKIRRVELRKREEEARADGHAPAGEFTLDAAHS
ncbi:MAG: AMP-binding protein [Polyangiaceae bacterium]